MQIRNLLHSSEPYRILFSLGAILLILGVLIWIPLLWNENSYPVEIHRYLVLYGFMGSYISGFLMTAIPRFSQTQEATKTELIIQLFSIIGGVICILLSKSQFAYFLGGINFILLFIFILKRIFKRKRNPPPSFIFIPVALGFAIYSSFHFAFTLSQDWGFLFHEGMLLAIILGVGSHLIPGILGHHDIQDTTKLKFKMWFLTLPIFFILNYLYFYQNLKNLILALVMFVCLFFWKLYQLPKEKSALTYSLWLSGWMILFSFILKFFFSDYGIHITHAFFISGATLLTLLISIRVLQSHGIENKLIENEKKIYLITALVLLSAATRVTALLVPSYTHHLAYSSFVLIVAFIIYIVSYLKFVFYKPTK